MSNIMCFFCKRRNSSLSQLSPHVCTKDPRIYITICTSSRIWVTLCITLYWVARILPQICTASAWEKPQKKLFFNWPGHKGLTPRPPLSLVATFLGGKFFLVARPLPPLGFPKRTWSMRLRRCSTDLRYYMNHLVLSISRRIHRIVHRIAPRLP